DPGFTGDQGELGRRLLYETGNDPWRVMLFARLPVIALTLAFGWVVFALARELAGTGAGLAALALYAFSPDLIAHGSLATLDVPAAGFVLTSAWLAWRARERPRRYVPLAGVALGAALATKMSTLPAVPVLLALTALSVWSARAPSTSRRRALGRAVAGAGVVALVAVAVVWLSYLVVDPRLRWDPEQPVPVVHGLRGLAVDLLPFPESYRDGMRVQFAFENHPWQGFLFGRLYTGALWYYLPAALLVKTPLGMLALWAAGVVAVLAVRRLRPVAPYLLAPSAVLLTAAMLGARRVAAGRRDAPARRGRARRGAGGGRGPGRRGGRPGGGAGTAARRGAAGAGRPAHRLQPGHPHLDAGPRPGRAGRRRPRHRPGAARGGRPAPRLGPAPRRDPAAPAGAGRRRGGPGGRRRGHLAGGLGRRRRGDPERHPHHGPRDPLTRPRAGGAPGRGGTRSSPPCGAVTLEAWQSSMYPKSSSPSPRPWSRSRPFWTSTS
ncbi:glycosyltransferase family 39 protein, partial [Streptomyces nigra]